MHELKAVVLEYQSGTYQGIEWAKIKARSTEVGGRILTYKVDPKKAGNLEQYVDKEVYLVLDITAGKDANGGDIAQLRVVGVRT